MQVEPEAWRKLKFHLVPSRILCTQSFSANTSSPSPTHISQAQFIDCSRIFDVAMFEMRQNRRGMTLWPAMRRDENT